MKLLFIGESWLGSSARSMREALARYPSVFIDEVSPNHFFPSARTRVTRAANRLLAPMQRQELRARVLEQAEGFRPDRIVFYKGVEFEAEFLRQLQRSFAPVVNIFPDYSPHAFGSQLTAAIGVYDLVASTKVFHPPLWQTTYGYANKCVFVPHGYDAHLHLRRNPASASAFDIAIVASGRPEYHALMREIARHLPGSDLQVALGGENWEEIRADVPKHWAFLGPRHGMAYVDAVRSSKILIAPIHSQVIVNGNRQPGDVDTTRSYELAAANCFFIHRRSDFLRTVYDEGIEVPMYENAAELARKIEYYLSHEAERVEMATAAHRRAVPAYSVDARAAELLRHLEAM